MIRELAPLEQITSCHYCGVRVSADLAECRRHMIACPKHPAHELYHALEESVKLQSHYATLLNQYDGGERMTFTVDSWLQRLNPSDRFL